MTIEPESMKPSWTAEIATTGIARGRSQGEIDRYTVWPGQACSYKIGHTEIVRQRARAQSALGSAYDMRAFNTAVVLGGNAPLSVMANTVSRYIAGAKG